MESQKTHPMVMGSQMERLTGYTIYQGYTRFSGEKGILNTKKSHDGSLCGPGLVVGDAATDQGT